MKKRTRVTLLVFLVLTSAGIAGWFWRGNRTNWGPTFDATSREEWIDKAIDHVSSFVPRPWSHRPRLVNITNDTFEFQLEGSGLVDFQDGNWVYIVTHSAHWEELSNQPYRIGNIAIARDNNGRLWQCLAHPCTAITLTPESRDGFRNLKEFLEKPVGLGDKMWERLTLSNNGVVHTR